VIQQNVQGHDLSFNELNVLNTLSLSNLDRAVQVARAFQYFKLVKVVARFKPYADTFAQGDPTQPPGSLPYFYYVVNKGETLDPTSFNGLRDAGAKPMRFDDKTITVTWKPSVLQFTKMSTGAGAAPAFNLSKTSPWLSTNDLAGTDSTTWVASTLQHTGITFGVETAVSGNPQYQYGVEYEITVAFKKPLTYSQAAENGKQTPINRIML